MTQNRRKNDPEVLLLLGEIKGGLEAAAAVGKENTVAIKELSQKVDGKLDATNVRLGKVEGKQKFYAGVGATIGAVAGWLGSGWINK